MPTTPYAKLLVSLNAGPTQSGAITTAANLDTVQLTAESTAQWDLTTPPRWEIYSYPPGWTGPAAGWTTESVTLPNGGTADVYVYLGLGPPPSFALPASPMWGKFLMRLTVQGGLLNGIPTPTLIDDTTALEILGPGGMRDTASLEGTQFSSSRAYVASMQENWRTIATALGAALAPYALTPAVVASGAGSAGVSPLYARGDHSHQLTFPALNTVLAAASAPITVNGQTLTSGGFIGPNFRSNGAAPATTGLLRGEHGTTLVCARSSGNTDNVPIVSYGTDVADHVTIGDPVIPCMRFVIASGCDFEFYHDADLLYTLAQGSISVGATNQFNILHTIGAGAGQDATIEAQGGAATFAGGDLILKSGAAGTGSTSGNVELDARKNAAGTRTGSVIMKGNTTTFAQFSHHVGDNITTAEFAANTTVLDTKELVLDASNIALNTSLGSYGGGTGILYVGPATTEPTADDTTGTLLWSKDTALKARNECRAILCPELEGAVSGETAWIPLVKAARVTTTDAVLTLAYSYAIPAHTIGDIEIVILGKCNATGDWTRVKETGAIDRFGGNATWTVSTQEVQPFGATLTYTTAISGGGGELEVKVQGINPETVKWLVVITVNQLTTVEV